MCLNVAKWITVVFLSIYKSNNRVLLSFPEFNLGCHPAIANVNSCKYLGYWLSRPTDDDDNIDRCR